MGGLGFRRSTGTLLMKSFGVQWPIPLEEDFGVPSTSF